MKLKDIDLSRKTPYRILALACAAAGAAGGIAASGAASLGAIITAGGLGAVAGAVILPAIVAGAGMAAYMVFENAVRFVKTEGKFIPLLSLMVGFTTLRVIAETAMKPFRSQGKKAIPGNGDGSVPPAASAEFTLPPSSFEKKIRTLFEEEAAKRKEPRRIRQQTSLEEEDYISISPGLTD